MPGTEKRAQVYRFDVFEFYACSGELRKHGISVKLQDQPCQILLLLLEQPGEIVSREEIQKHLWPENTFVDFENAINTAVRKLRGALGDTARRPRFVETLARRGYRFVAVVSPNSETASTEAAVTPPASTKRRLSPALAAAIMLGVVSMAAIWTVQKGANEEPTEVRVTPLTGNAGFELQPSFSPEGTQVAYVWNGPEGKDVAVYVKRIGTGNPVRVTSGPARDFSSTWSPDGRWIAALRHVGNEQAIVLIPASGGPPRELTRVIKGHDHVEPCFLSPRQSVCGTVFHGTWLAWSADGKFLFSSGSVRPDSALAVIRISIETGEHTWITSPPAAFFGDVGPALSPDGRVLAFVRAIGDYGSADIYTTSLAEAAATTRPRRVTFDGDFVGTPIWTRDGRELIFSSTRGGRRELWRVSTSRSASPVRRMGTGNGHCTLRSSSGART